jgi:hypothetical protein
MRTHLSDARPSLLALHLSGIEDTKIVA